MTIWQEIAFRPEILISEIPLLQIHIKSQLIPIVSGFKTKLYKHQKIRKLTAIFCFDYLSE